MHVLTTYLYKIGISISGINNNHHKENNEPNIIIKTFKDEMTYGEYNNILLQWENEVDLYNNEHRKLAVDTIKSCIESNEKELDLSGFNLTSLPKILPSNITTLIVKNNELKEIPEELFENIKVIDASHNHITDFPNIINKEMEFFDLSYNHISFIPDMYRYMNNKSHIYLNGNNLTVRTINEMNDQNLNAPCDYEGIKIHYQETTTQPSILEIINKLMPHESICKQLTINHLITLEKNITERMDKNEITNYHHFVNFLDYFYHATKVDKRKCFIDEIISMLEGMTKDKEDREEIFNIAKNTMINCKQEVISGYVNIMIRAVIKEINAYNTDYKWVDDRINYLMKMKTIESIISPSKENRKIEIYDNNSPLTINRMSVFLYLYNKMIKERFSLSKYEEHCIKKHLKNTNQVKEIFDKQMEKTINDFHCNLESYNVYSSYAKKNKYKKSYTMDYYRKRSVDIQIEKHKSKEIKRLKLSKENLKNNEIDMQISVNAGRNYNLEYFEKVNKIIMDNEQ